MKRYKILIFLISTLALFSIVPQFGSGMLLNTMLPLYSVVFVILLWSPIRVSGLPLIPIILTAAMLYVINCDFCSIMNKSLIFTLWLAYSGAMVSHFLDAINPTTI